MRFLALISTVYLLSAGPAWSQNDDPSLHDEYNKNTLLYNEESGLYTEDATILSRSEQTGLYDPAHNTDDDKGRLGFQYSINGDLLEAAEIQEFEINFGHKLERYWLDFFVAYMRAEFDEIARNNNGTGGDSEDLKETREDITTFGVGLGLRTRMLKSLFNTSSVFEYSSGYATYSVMDENFRSLDYDGFGMRANFGIYQRANSKMHYGVRLSYNLANLSNNDLDNGEGPTSERSLLLTWMTIGFDLSFYF